MRRVFVYVDGFNLYHAVDELNDDSLKWLDLWALSESICGNNETVVSVNYFSAFATWRPDAYKRHRDYVKALELEGVTKKMGNFKKRYINCKSCGVQFERHEEKETDVNIGINLVADAARDRFQRAILISADSDLAPAVELAKTLSPNAAINVVAPPKRFSHARDLKPIFALPINKIKKARLQEQYLDTDGSVIVECPQKYRRKP